MNNGKILVTGGAGFIGGNFIHYLIQHYPQYEIFNLDKLTYAGELSKHNSLGSQYHFIHGDITDKRMMYDLFSKERFDYVIHFAAESHVDRSISNPSVFIQTNIYGTYVLLEASLKSGIT